MQNNNRKKPYHALCIFWVLLLSVLFVYSGHIFAAEQKYAGVNIVNPETGRAEIVGKSEPYFYLKARITSTNKTTIAFKLATCAIKDTDGKEHSDCWIRISGWSKGLSVSQNPPLSMKTLSVKTTGDQATHKWNTSKVSGPKGSIEIKLPENGFVDLYFLWELPANVNAKVISIKDLFEMRF